MNPPFPVQAFTIYYIEENVIVDAFTDTAVELWRKLARLVATGVMFGCVDSIPYSERKGMDFGQFVAYLCMTQNSLESGVGFGFDGTKFWLDQIELDRPATRGIQ